MHRQFSVFVRLVGFMGWFKVGTRTGTACDGGVVVDLGVLQYGVGGQDGGGFRWAHFCPLMDCDMDRGGIMSNRYSLCRSAKLELLWAPTAAGFR